VPCIHENALLLVDGLDDGRAEDAAGLAGGEEEGGGESGRETRSAGIAGIRRGSPRSLAQRGFAGDRLAGVHFIPHGTGPLEQLRGRNGSFRFEQDADLRYRHTVTLEA
jgi:hypothetical protein